MIAKESIEEVKLRASLLDVAGEVVKLRRQGSSMVGLCPFHSERSPSFHIRDNGKFFHCFGCGASGNVIAFVMQIRGLSFPDAVTELAQRYGITLRKAKGERRVAEGDAAEKRRERDGLLKLNSFAREWFSSQISKPGNPGARYVQSRRVLPEVADEFGIGYAPPDFHGLEQYLTEQRKVPAEWLARSGLVRRNERGETYDTFRGRLIFPILDERRRVIGFGGRHLEAPQTKGVASAETSSDVEGNGEKRKIPKYINSPETAVYEKSKVLYGLPHALTDLRATREAYIVEGYFDVIGLWQAGVKTALAPCGTALTEAHVRRLSHLVSRVTLLFDGDAAGVNAAGKAFPLFVNSGLDVQVAQIPGGEDPDTFALKAGAQAREALAKLPRRPLLDCYIEHLCRAVSVSGEEVRPQALEPAAKGKVAAQLSSTLGLVKNSIERAELIERASTILKIRPELLSTAEGARADAVSSPTEPTDSSSAPSEQEVALPTMAAERELLRLAMKHKGPVVTAVLGDGALCELLSSVTLEFLAGFATLLSNLPADQEGRKKQVRALLSTFGRSWEALWREAHKEVGSSMLTESGAELSAEAIEQGLAHLRRLAKKQRIQMVMTEIEGQIQAAGSDQEKLELARARVELARQMAVL